MLQTLTYNNTMESIQEHNNWKELIESAYANPVKKAILEFLIENESTFFGNLVEILPFSYMVILENILELKNLGIVLKNENQAKFSLNTDAFASLPSNVA